MADVVLDPTTRAPSSPLAALIRSVVFVPIALFASTKLAAMGVPVDQEKIVVALVAGAAFLGKVLRNKFDWAKWLPF
jgi:hypothetical protein